MNSSYMNFKVDGDALVPNLIDGEIKGLIYSRKNPAKRKEVEQSGLVGKVEPVHEFVRKYFKMIVDQGLINKDGTTIFGNLLTLSDEARKPEFSEHVKNILRYEYDVPEEVMPKVNTFIKDYKALLDRTEIRKVVGFTQGYKDSIERIWDYRGQEAMDHVIGILGYKPQRVSTVNAYIMYPTHSVLKTCQLKKGETSMYFAKSGETDANKLLAQLTHQAVHQPMLPYKPNMTKSEREKFHAFIKFLTDKEVYGMLTNQSPLGIVTKGENGELMGSIYPFYLAYRYRKSPNSVGLITAAIRRDKAKYDELVASGSKDAKKYETYNFDKIDPVKLSRLFVERKGITPYEFYKLDFSDKSQVYKNKYLSQEVDGNGER